GYNARSWRIRQRPRRRLTHVPRETARPRGEFGADRLQRPGGPAGPPPHLPPAIAMIHACPARAAIEGASGSICKGTDMRDAAIGRERTGGRRAAAEPLERRVLLTASVEAPGSTRLLDPNGFGSMTTALGDLNGDG